MKKYKNILLALVFFLVFIFISYYFLQNTYNLNFRKIVFPWKYISIYEKEAKEVRRDELIKDELILRDKLTEIFFYKIESTKKLTKNLSLVKFMGDSKLIVGIYRLTPGSFYLSKHASDIYLTSSTGVIGVSEISDKYIKFKTIKNNLGNFLNIEQFRKSPLSNKFSIKDSQIIDGKIYVSLTKEVKENCWNITMLSAILNNEKLIFEEIFSPKECVHSEKNEDNYFNSHSSGGRITNFNKNYVFLSIGDFGYMNLPQAENSLFGKILKVHKFEKNDYELISKGHRNQQGLYYDKNIKVLIETEHGPQGGDEINIINPTKKNQNFGWPIASYGEHYGFPTSERTDKLYSKYPLFKSHKKYSFIEPIKYFVPSIGISQIVKIEDSTYALTSLKKKSLYIIKLNKKNQIYHLEELHIGERIRDVIYFKNSLFLSLEDTASIGYITLN